MQRTPESIIKGPTYGELVVTSRVPCSHYSKGNTSKFCNKCLDFSECKERVRGKQPVLIDGKWETVFVDQYIGKCGHVVEDDSA